MLGFLAAMPMIVIPDGSAVYSSHHAHEEKPLKPESDNNFASEPAFCTILQGVCPRASQSCPGAAQQHGTGLIGRPRVWELGTFAGVSQ